MRKFLDRWFARAPRSVQPVSRRARPTLEVLEDRLAPAVFTVNSTADILNPTGGTVTLRSAIEQANATTGNNTINLSVAGTYFITIPGADQGNNATGAFDVIPNAASPAGSTLSIINTSGGTVIVDGNHLDRVFDINPGNTDNPATKDTVLMQGFTIQNGIAQTGDGAMGSGGGIRDQGNTSLTLTDMVITNNQATADGGGVSMENAPASTPWTLTVNNSVISYNHAGDAGGGLETDGKGKTFINAGTVITGNTTLNQGAGIWLDAIADGVASVTITNPGTGYTAAPTVTFSAPDNAGGVTATGTATVVGGVVTAVTITDPGSGYINAPTVTIGAPPAGTTATATAALGFDNSSNLTITGALISGNTAVNGPTGGIGNAGAGAVTIANSTVENNFSGTTGGGFGDQNNLGTLTVTNSLFLNNTALTDGGGIQEGGPTTAITNTEIKNNTAGLSGGGIFASGTTLTILSSTIANNIASGNPGTGANGNGGGIELETTGASTITDATIYGNSALNNNGTNNGTPQFGGGIDAADTLFTGSLTLLADTINGNFATNGGGIFFGTTGAITVQNTIVAGNIAQTTGPDANNIGAAFTDGGGNLIGNPTGSTGFTSATTQVGTANTPLDPMLGPLTNNLGPLVGAAGTAITLETEVLSAGSPALARGVTNGAPATDEIGFPRVVNNSTDVGATQTQTGINFEADTHTLDVHGNVVLYTQATTADALGLHTTYTFTVDGQVFTIPGVELAQVIVAGTGSKPMITLTTSDTYTGTDGLTHETVESFVLGNGGGVMAQLRAGGATNFMQILGFTTVDVFAGPADLGQISGTVGVMNTFVGAGGYAYMDSGSAFYYIGGAKYVYGYAANPGDLTYEYDGSGASTLVISGVAYSYMTGTDAGANFFNEGVGFRNNYAVTKHPGQDTAYFFDSPANDVFVGNTGTSYMYSTNSAGNFTEFDEVMGSFAIIIAESFVGGTDFAYNNDPAHIMTAGFHMV